MPETITEVISPGDALEQRQTSPAVLASASPVRGRKRRLAAVVLVALGCVGLAVGVPWYLYARAHEATDDAFIDGHIVQIGPKVFGQVARVCVDDNQRVDKGQLLLEIDPSDYQARFDRAQATWNAAAAGVALIRTTSEADVAQATSGVEIAQSGVQTATAMVAAARSKQVQTEAQIKANEAAVAEANAEVAVGEAEVSRADTELGRIQQLRQSDSASPQELTNALASDRAANARLEAARKKAAVAEADVAQARAAQQSAAEDVHQTEAQLLEAKARVGEAQAKLASARSAPQQVAVRQAQAATAAAERDQAKLDLSYTKIYAPEAGRVTHKGVEAGNYVQVGQALMAIVPDTMWVTANYKETQLTWMRPGQPAQIRIDAYPDLVFQGHVDSIQSGTGARFSLLPPENATGNYVKVVQRVPVKITFDESPDRQHPLGPGMSVVPVVKVR